eukprot:369323_1
MVQISVSWPPFHRIVLRILQGVPMSLTNVDSDLQVFIRNVLHIDPSQNVNGIAPPHHSFHYGKAHANAASIEKSIQDAQKKPKKPKKPRGGNKRGLGKFVCVAKPSEIENKKNVVKFCKLYKINIDNWCLNFGETELQAAEGIAEYEDLFGIAE